MSFLAQHNALSNSSECPQSHATDHVTCSKGRKQHLSTMSQITDLFIHCICCYRFQTLVTKLPV